MASAESQDFSSDSATPGQMNKYGFSYPQSYAVPHTFYPTPIPMTGYYAPMVQNDNPTQELLTMGFKGLQYIETSADNTDPLNPYAFQLKLEGIEKTFTGVGTAKKKARKAAAQNAVDHLIDPSNVPEGMELKSPKKVRGTYVQPVPSGGPWGQMAQPPPGYMVPIPAPQYPPMEFHGPVKGNKPEKLEKVAVTPSSILREKYPDSRWKAEVNCTVTVNEQEFSVTLPGGNYHLAKMIACANALKELEGMEFPKWDRKLERVHENSKDSTSMEIHPVSLLLREYGVRNVSFKQESMASPCTVTIKHSGESRAYSSAVQTNKRQAKYDAALLAIKELNLDSKFPNIVPFQSQKSEDRKRKISEMLDADNSNMVDDDFEAEEDKATEEVPEKLSFAPASQTQLESQPEQEAEFKIPDPVTLPDPVALPDPVTLPDPVALPNPVAPPPSEKRARVEPPSTAPTEADEVPEERRQPIRPSAPGGSPRYNPRGRARGARVLIRGSRGQVYGGGYRGAQHRYF